MLIIGAGPTGLGAAWRLDGLGCTDWILCEAGQSAGGLAGSVVDKHGFTWDFGGHVQFSHYDYFDKLMDELLGPDGWLYHEREAWIRICDTFVPYPFQLNLHRLPTAAQGKCMQGLEQLASSPPPQRPENFGEWMEASFGEGIMELFMRPYNGKVWARPPEEMDWGWIGDRVANVELKRVRQNTSHSRDALSWGPNNRFRFPLRGGTGEIWRVLMARLRERNHNRVRMGWRLEKLQPENREAIFSNGHRVRYRRLLSTIPLDTLITLSTLMPVLEYAVQGLEYNSTHVLGIGLEGTPGPHLAGKCWIYFPESDCPFYRVTVFSHYSPNNVPDIRRYWSLMAEVSESPKRPVDVSNLEEETLQGLLNTGLVTSREDVHHVWHHRLEHGYPVPGLRRDSALAVLLPFLEEKGIYSRGRFGAWKYEVSNQDHSFAQGVEVVDHWLSGGDEVTLHKPDVVNSSRSIDG